MERIRKAVIPAAGMGKRFYPLTRAQPKEMLPILDKPVIHYVVQEAVNSGLDEILIIVGYGKDAIINYFDRHPLEIYSQLKILSVYCFRLYISPVAVQKIGIALFLSFVIFSVSISTPTT